MSTVIDALAQWDALAQREIDTCYQRKLSSATSADALKLRMPVQKGQHTNKGCPSAWREQVVEWCFQVVDYCEIDRDVVSYAMSYFDRIFPHYCINDRLIELVAVTCLYLAIKIHCSNNKVSIDCIISLSGCSFQYDQVVKMERVVLRGLNWHLHPATPHSFLEIFFSTSAEDDEVMDEIKETASYLLELATCDVFFISEKPSCICTAAILIALDIVNSPLRSNFMMKKLIENNDRDVIKHCSIRLKQIYAMMVKQGAIQETVTENDVSPTSVIRVN